MIATLELEEVAEEHAVGALRKLHFSIMRRWTPVAAGSAILEAWTGSQHIFVRVNAAVAPAEPASLSPDEKQELRQRAARTDGEAWEARVVVGPDGELVQLEWWPLERSGAGE
ncbi:MAG: hypothetical protein LAO05_16415 [Acidobacteriia bacterium]|nr:hypothetical protein [Terriglobia bacterium]